MSFRGIDPAGLTELAYMAGSLADRAHTDAGRILAILDTSRYTSAAHRLGARATGIASWGDGASSNLRWRSEVISEGQAAQWIPRAILRAAFAAEAVFQMHEVDAAFEGWLLEQAASRERVDAAVADIGRWLDQTWTDWDVTNNDLQQIRATLESLSPTELDRALRRLSPTQLQRWVAEMGHGCNGFSREEKAEVFTLLAGAASGDTLAGIHDAVLAAGSLDDLILLGEAFAAAAPDGPIVAFVARAARSGLTNTRYSGLAPAIAITGIDNDEAATAVLATLVDDGLATVLVDCLLLDETRYEPLVATLSRAADADHRASAFLAVASLADERSSLRDLAEERSPQRPGDHEQDNRSNAAIIDTIAAGLLDAATHLLLADPEPVVQELATTQDPSGEATAHYWYLMTEAGHADEIAAIVSGLRGGAEIDIAAFARSGDNPDYPYPHARNLAYGAATLNMGMKMTANEAAEDIESIVMVGGVATTVFGLISPGPEVIATLLGNGSEWLIDDRAERTNKSIAAQLEDLIDQVSAALRPTDEGAAGVSGAPMNAWIDVYLDLDPDA